jgi:hypothetical protein
MEAAFMREAESLYYFWQPSQDEIAALASGPVCVRYTGGARPAFEVICRSAPASSRLRIPMDLMFRFPDLAQELSVRARRFREREEPAWHRLSQFFSRASMQAPALDDAATQQLPPPPPPADPPAETAVESDEDSESSEEEDEAEDSESSEDEDEEERPPVKKVKKQKHA